MFVGEDKKKKTVISPFFLPSYGLNSCFFFFQINFIISFFVNVFSLFSPLKRTHIVCHNFSESWAFGFASPKYSWSQNLIYILVSLRRCLVSEYFEWDGEVSFCFFIFFSMPFLPNNVFIFYFFCSNKRVLVGELHESELLFLNKYPNIGDSSF